MIRRTASNSPLAVSIPTFVNGDRSSGTGKMWHRVADGLSALGVTVRVSHPSRRLPMGRKPDVWLTSGHAGALNVRQPVVAHMQEAPWLEPDEQHFLEPAFRDICLERGQASSREATMIITPSEASRLQVVATHGVAPEMVRIVPHGVDLATFNPSRGQAGADLIARAGGTKPYVAFVSSVHPRKNLGALRAAMVILADRGLEHRLVLLIRPAPDRKDSTQLWEEAIEELPGHPGRVLVLRELEERQVAELMAAADVLCAPSWSEGFGFAPLEAMACGTPVVVSDRGSLPEVVGEAGVVVAPEPEALADALQEVLCNPDRARTLGEAGLERSREFAWPVIASRWRDLLVEAADR